MVPFGGTGLVRGLRFAGLPVLPAVSGDVAALFVAALFAIALLLGLNTGLHLAGAALHQGCHGFGVGCVPFVVGTGGVRLPQQPPVRLVVRRIQGLGLDKRLIEIGHQLGVLELIGLIAAEYTLPGRNRLIQFPFRLGGGVDGMIVMLRTTMRRNRISGTGHNQRQRHDDADNRLAHAFAGRVLHRTHLPSPPHCHVRIVPFYA